VLELAARCEVSAAVLDDRTFEAVVLDWDGTAVPDRRADASAARARVESLCAAGVHVFVVSGTHVDNVDGQLRARPAGPGRLHLCLNRGSEVFEVAAGGPRLRWRRTADPAEDAMLDRAAARLAGELRARRLDTALVSSRLNRRKLDLIPEAAWADPPKASIAGLLDAVTGRVQSGGLADLSDVVGLAREAASAEGLDDARVTTDVKHVEIGLTDKSDAAHWAAAWLAARGITGNLVLVCGDELGTLGGAAGSDSLMLVPELARAAVVSVGVEPAGVPAGVLHVGGGPIRFLAILDAQLRRRVDRRVPSIDADPAWVIELPEAPSLERVAESLGTVANGSVGTRAGREEIGPGPTPLVAASGVYADGEDVRLLAGPTWTALSLAVDLHGSSRLLDLRTGVLHRSEGGSGFRSIRFASLARPSALALRAEARAEVMNIGAGLVAPARADRFESDQRGQVHLARTVADRGTIAMAAHQTQGIVDGVRAVERLVSCVRGRDHRPSWDEAERRLAECEEVGFDGLLAEQREAWARRWTDAHVAIDGAPEDELAARFAVFHLLASVAAEGEAALGARGLTGPAYGGHVFWDADVFVLPALAALRPAAARAMLEYRIRRLPAARDAAAAQGRQGARFPWESADDGRDVTPRQARGPQGRPVRIVTGEYEEHIVADVAWAASEYAAWSGDEMLPESGGRDHISDHVSDHMSDHISDLVFDTARYWASRAEFDGAGRAHLRGVMGPDEYHTLVDDNAFTNVMARWNLRRAANLGEGWGGDGRERARWREVADALVDGYDPERGLYEQFAGYWSLEPLLAANVAAPPVAADVVLGAERVAGSQIIKQADVLMLHHLVPGEVAPGSLAAHIDYYEPRTAHGSSLSPAITAALLARAGQADRALELFRVATRMDLDDLTGTTASGLHLATMGGVWQALAYGFLGLRPATDALAVDPCLPRAWAALELSMRFHGGPVRVRARHDEVTVACDRPIHVRVGDDAAVRCDAPGRSFTIPSGAP
jgi:trehalose/maltose hydrolase-like predicted phosphorylase